jgi:O-acetyl-ADP-ribose deacetylase (regulator of RNase III)
MYLQYTKGDLITLAKAGNYDVIAHGNNCFCSQDRGIAKHFNTNFSTADPALYCLEAQRFRGDINKLGQVEARTTVLNFDQQKNKGTDLVVANLYTQYRYGNDKMHADYDAIRLCMRKLNHMYKDQRVGLPRIGCGLAGADWMIVERIIKQELIDCTVTIVEYEGASDKRYSESELTSN